MSTKTNFKRVALVAVAALGLGVLTSVAPATATTFSTADTLILGTTNTTNGTAVGGVVLTTATPGLSSSGIISTTGGTAVAADATDNAYRSLASGAVGTGIVFPGSRLGFGIDATAAASIIVSGGTWGSVTGSTGINGANTIIVGTTAAFGGVVTVSAAAGSTVTVQAFTGSGIAGTSSATNGALVGIWTFTVAAASAAGVPSLADSTITQQAGIDKGVAASTVLTYDTASRMANGKVGLIYINLKDAYESAVITGTLTAQSTAGTVNVVVAGSAASGDSYAATTAFDSVGNSSGAFYVYVNQPVANTAGSATVTLTLSGTVIGTKTLNWSGDAATIALIPASSSANFANGYAAYSSGDAKNLNVAYVVKDAAGNNVTLTTQPTLTDATGSLAGASLSAATDTTGTAAAGDIDTLYQTSSNGYGLATMLVPSSTLSGAGSYTLSFVNTAGATIKSSVNNATVSRGSINSFEASWNKASYAPGEIATLTITAKDAFGNLIADGTAAAGLDLIVNTAGLTSVGSALTTTSTFSGGSITQKYAAGNTDGAYAYSVDLNTATPQSAAVGAVNIKATSTATSNADVLKAIVSLIASINKQIAALQKALLRR